MVPSGVADVAPWGDWLSAAEGALRFLHGYVGWDLWVVTHVEDDRQIIVRSFPESLVRPGTELPWAQSFCRQMIEGNAPRVATVTAAVPAYASRSYGSIRDIAAYVGVPLVTRDLELFGTLCGIAFRAKPRSASRELPVVEHTARMLNTLLATDLPAPTRTDLR
ncbi:histidine kinase [Blastococcus sp. BMG 814]|uniref:Histidine kinase n=1 Tax=Blastococcus carthaginiensis TaxID=3050034 RepID=A0ABT9I657_9ACTN|nr:histidine kinase [Blastococcus carthaginiensis]MDP5181057.1 histidine kinase [Blastococcus carthaginiensis]